MLSVEEVRRELSFDQPFLAIADGCDRITVTGEFLVAPASDEKWTGAFDRFHIRVEIPKNFPHSEPLVFETGNRIPQTIDRHCFTSGACCTGVYEEWIAVKHDRTIGAFFEGPLRNFFLSQIYFEQHGNWPFGERSHGNEGLVEACVDLLGISKSENRAIDYLAVLSGAWPKGHWICPCGSGKRIRHCHRKELMAMHDRMPPHLAKRLLKRLVPQKSLKRKQR